MFKSRSEGNVVYKCSIRLLDDSFLELEFQVGQFELVMHPYKNFLNVNPRNFRLQSSRRHANRSENQIPKGIFRFFIGCFANLID